MNGKTVKAKPKMADVTKPKKLTTEDQLVIQSRPMIGRATSVSSPVDETKPQPDNADSSTTAPVLPSQSKRTLIVPVSDGNEKTNADASPKDAPVPDDSKQSKAEPSPKDAAPAEAADQKAADSPALEPPAATKEAPTPDDEDKPEAADDDSKAGDSDEKPSPATEKALKEAAAAEKRANELQSLIDSKQFYVPINAVAQRRSIKYSSLMTVFVFLLALVLIDLMLDTGMILLVQKIPHTHFFSQNPDSTTQVK